eukprot:jgi/Chrpa1/17930/Chrysochromulina_OHIO_Genome00007355-RA
MAMSVDSSATACLNPRQRIAIGDLVIVYEDFKTLHAVRVAPPARFDSRHGSFPHADFVGRRFGERVSEPRGRGGFVYLLSPSPELWTATLPHRTQILYIADISMIVLQLELQPGRVCIEAGTGSGSLSHALARAVGARGHLHTFEFNAHRAQLAAAEFAANGLGGRVTSLHGDVCADGWEYANTAHGSVDAAIFDLPQPWDAVRHVASYLRPGGRLCTFSPCIEQIARTQEALVACGFTGIEVIEVVVRTHAVSQQQGGDASSALALALAQGARAAMASAAQAASAPAALQPRTSEAAMAAEAMAAEAMAAEAMAAEASPATAEGEGEAAAAAAAAAKRPRVEDGGDDDLAPPAKESKASPEPAATAAPPAAEPPATAAAAAILPKTAPPAQLSTRPYSDMRGHTGFLLFCSKHVG